MRKDKASAIVRTTIGNNVVALREERHLSQSALAQEAEVDRSHLGRIERGAENASMDILVRIADALNVPLMDLFRGLENCPPRKLPEQGYLYTAIEVPPES